MAFAGNRIESAGLRMSANYVYSYLAKFHFEYYLTAGAPLTLYWTALWKIMTLFSQLRDSVRALSETGQKCVRCRCWLYDIIKCHNLTFLLLPLIEVFGCASDGARFKLHTLFLSLLKTLHLSGPFVARFFCCVSLCYWQLVGFDFIATHRSAKREN